jgi:hypothetical protein
MAGTVDGNPHGEKRKGTATLRAEFPDDNHETHEKARNVNHLKKTASSPEPRERIGFQLFCIRELS